MSMLDIKKDKTIAEIYLKKGDTIKGQKFENFVLDQLSTKNKKK